MVVPRGNRRRGYIVHLTSVANLVSIWAQGRLLADSTMSPEIEVDELGSTDIKAHRRVRPVHCSAMGVVADYVPFYYCARSPMLYFAHTNNPLSPFTGGDGHVAGSLSP